MIMILFVYRKHFSIRLFQLMMKELILKVTIYYGQTIQVTKKKGGVCMYYKEHLPVIKRDDLCTLKKCLVTEIIADKKKLFFFRVFIDHQVRLKMSLRSFVMT